MMRIGVLDSGVGGLIVANELRRAFSNIGVVFIADSANFPYGNKSDEQLVDIVHDRIMLLERMDVDIIVLACNTASSIAERYRIKCDTPLVSIIDATVQQATASVDSECFRIGDRVHGSIWYLHQNFRVRSKDRYALEKLRVKDLCHG